jgi:hypothetical protein
MTVRAHLLKAEWNSCADFVWRTPGRYLSPVRAPFCSRTVCARRLARGGCSVGQAIVLLEEASAVAGPRFVFLSRTVTDENGGTIGEYVTWMVVSPNSRPLGRAADWFVRYDDCRDAVLAVRERAGELRIVISVAGSDWHWRGTVDGIPVAASTRAYLRQHECDYNAQRFLEALPEAQILTAVRAVRSGMPIR